MIPEIGHFALIIALCIAFVQALVPLAGTGEPAALFVLEDVTEVLRGQRLQAWAEMARMIAHEVKNPLTPIRLSTEHLLEVHRSNRDDLDEVLERCTANILRQVDGAVPTKVKDELFREDAEWDLAAKLMGLKPRVQQLLGEGNYTDALTALAGLRESVDGFFDEVKVMDDDEAVKNNRLAMLATISELFLHTADIGRLQD